MKIYRELTQKNPEHFWANGRICSKTYAKGSGMIPRLDFAVER